jgi:hypothetical protein
MHLNVVSLFQELAPYFVFPALVTVELANWVHVQSQESHSCS